ncbi:MAG: hypothetical protein PHO91_01485 [Patescibacteria group bacterium]|nr:hypothetical protein [Patescibacteria group bacterium]
MASFGIYKISFENKPKIINEAVKAEQTLISFFTYLNDQDFDKALTLFELDGSTSSWENLEIFSLPEDRNDKAKILKRYCEATGTCLRAKVIDIKKENNGTYNLLVQFQKADGSTFVLGPCCGATEEEMPSQNKFNFEVKKIDNTFKVTTAPIYVP